MRARKPSLADRSRSFLDAYTHGLKREDVQRLFTRDTREAYRFFARHIDETAFTGLSRHRRWLMRARLLFWAFTLRLSPARRLLYGVALLLCLLGFINLFHGFSAIGVPVFLGPVPVEIGLPLPHWAPGAGSLFVGFLLINLLVLLEVADRLSLKNDLEIAREIQHAMLPQAAYDSATLEPGDMLVLYSDGVTEAENHQGQPFEESGLERIVDVHADSSPFDLAKTILRVVEIHAQETFLADDLTVLVVKRKDRPTSS